MTSAIRPNTLRGLRRLLAVDWAWMRQARLISPYLLAEAVHGFSSRIGIASWSS